MVRVAITVAWLAAACGRHRFDPLPDGVTISLAPCSGFAGGTHAGTRAAAALELDGSQVWVLDTSWLDLSGLAGYWHMDGSVGVLPNASTVDDSSGFGFHARSSDGATDGTMELRAGKLGQAVWFDGDDDQFAIGDVVASSPAVTLAAWVRHDSLGPGTGIQRYITVQTGTSFGAYVLRHQDYNGPDLLHYYLYNGTFRDIEVPSTLTVGDWYQLIGTWDGVTMRLYRNGYPIATLTPPSGSIAGTTAVNLGSADETMHGLLDEIAVWRRPLARADIEEIFERQAPAAAGVFESAICDAGPDLPGWASLQIVPERPYSKVTVNAAETGYAAGGLLGAGLVGRWSLNGGGPASTGDPILAEVGTGLDGVAVNPDGANMERRPGRFGRGMYFDGIDDRIEIPHDAAVNFGANDDFTIALWMRGDCPVAGTLVDKWDNFAGTPYPFSIRCGSGTVNFIRYDTVNNPSAATTSTTNDGQWHHVAGVKDGATLRIYLDGVEEAAVPDTTTAPQNTDIMRFGSRNGVRFFDGALDEIGIWNRALAPAEISELYLRGTLRARYQVRACPTPDCAGIGWVGPAGAPDTSFAEGGAASPPTFDLSFLPAERYLQYRVLLDSYAAANSPRLLDVMVTAASP